MPSNNARDGFYKLVDEICAPRGASEQSPAPADEPPGSGLHSPPPPPSPPAQVESVPCTCGAKPGDAHLYECAKVSNLEVDEAVYENAGTHLMDKYFGIHDTLVGRATRCGDFTDNALISQELKQVIRTNTDGTLREGYKQCSFVQREALEMIAQKIARILNGDSDCKNNWRDIQGYAKLAEERCRER